MNENQEGERVMNKFTLDLSKSGPTNAGGGVPGLTEEKLQIAVQMQKAGLNNQSRKKMYINPNIRQDGHCKSNVFLNDDYKKEHNNYVFTCNTIITIMNAWFQHW